MSIQFKPSDEYKGRFPDVKPEIKVGDTWIFDGIEYRVVSGKNAVGDKVIQFRVTGWHTPSLAHTFILCDFKFQVEENNYPRASGFKGGQYLLDAIKRAVTRGWRIAYGDVSRERQNKSCRQDDFFQ